MHHWSTGVSKSVATGLHISHSLFLWSFHSVNSNYAASSTASVVQCSKMSYNNRNCSAKLIAFSLTSILSLTHAPSKLLSHSHTHCPHTEQMHKGQGLFWILLHTYTLIHFLRSQQLVWLSQLWSLAETETADEGRATRSSTTLVITSQGTESTDH